MDSLKKLKIWKVVLLILGGLFGLGATLIGSRIENKTLEKRIGSK